VSHNPGLLLVYGLLVVFFCDVAWLFYVAYIRDRRKW
jgi:hypothetical protein